MTRKKLKRLIKFLQGGEKAPAAAARGRDGNDRIYGNHDSHHSQGLSNAMHGPSIAGRVRSIVSFRQCVEQRLKAAEGRVVNCCDCGDFSHHASFSLFRAGEFSLGTDKKGRRSFFESTALLYYSVERCLICLIRALDQATFDAVGGVATTTGGVAFRTGRFRSFAVMNPSER